MCKCISCSLSYVASHSWMGIMLNVYLKSDFLFDSRSSVKLTDRKNYPFLVNIAAIP